MARNIIFKKHETIGAAAAEQDQRILQECFIDTGILQTLLDTDDHRCIIVGRTGSGKSALISQISLVENSIILNPDNLSLSYIYSSTVLNYFQEIGVNLNLFYRLLWKHIFCVEILRKRYGIYDEHKKQSFLQSLFNSKKRRAIDYLRQWGDSFWQETDYRLKEVVNKLENDLISSIKSVIPEVIDANFSVSKKISEEKRSEVVYLGQQIVNKIQMRDLSSILDFIEDEVLSDKHKKYYIAIDRLDEDWIEEKLRLRFIRALIEVSFDFNKKKNIKSIISIRSDLLDRVYRFTRDTGFQEEKYKTSIINLSWSKRELIDLIDKRIQFLFKNQYTNEIITNKDVLSVIKKGKSTTNAIDYMIERTLNRPRDIIQFFNECIKQADGQIIINNSILYQSEGNYSRERFRALLDEWIAIYPNLHLLSNILFKKPTNLKVEEINDHEIIDTCLNIVSHQTSDRHSDINTIAQNLIDLDTKNELIIARNKILIILYKTGLIGIKTTNQMPIDWSFDNNTSVSEFEIQDTSRIFVHPTFWRHFGINSQDETS